MTSTHTLARRDDRSTSFEAAARQTKGKRAVLYRAIMEELHAFGPVTDEALLRGVSQRLAGEVTPSGLRSRRNELVLAGWVTEHRDADGNIVKKRGTSGSPQTVWRRVWPNEEHTPPKPMRRSKGATLGDTESPEHAAGLAVARRAAAWHIGDPAWADTIIQAYLAPAITGQALDEDGAPR